MKKKILTFLSFIFISISLLTGCGGFMGDESLVISSVTTELLDDGRTMIILTYTDETIDPSIFYIPKGEQGEQGLQGDGIKSIDHNQDPVSGIITITISFTNPDMEDITYTLNNGVSILSVETSEPDENGTIYMTINYSDGTSSEPIALPKGEKGEDGDSISKYDYIVNDDQSVTIVFQFKSGRNFIVDIPAPQQGEDGRGIKSIGSYEDEQNYILIIEFTDDSEPQEIRFSKPTKPNEWLYGLDEPVRSLGRDGDYYYDQVSKDIYHKENGDWILIIDFEDTETKCTIEFDLNGEGAKFPTGMTSNTFSIPKGSNFASSGKAVPTPNRPGYIFNGWYVTDNPSIVNGAFNDLTIVTGPLTLYANWIIEE